MEIYEILEKQSCRVQVQAKNKDEDGRPPCRTGRRK